MNNIKAKDHNRILAIIFAAFAVILALPFLLMIVVNFFVFLGMGLYSSSQTGKLIEAVIGIFGAVFAVVFLVLIGMFFVVPSAVAGWKMFKQLQNARFWGIIAAVSVIWAFPFGTALTFYAFWFLLGDDGKKFYSETDTEILT